MNHKYLITNLILVTIAFCGYGNNFSQKIVGQKIYPPSKSKVETIYHQQNYYSWDYLNGSHYRAYHISRESNPFLNFRFGEGIIYSKGYQYPDLTLAYDAYMDEVINIPHKQEFATVNIKINRTTIDSFLFVSQNGEHLFTNIEKIDHPLHEAEGFYEISRYKNFTFYFKHKMVLTNSEGLDLFVPSLQKQIFIDGALNKVQSRRHLLKYFPKYKKQIKQKLRTFDASFRKLSSKQVIEVLDYIDSLQKG